MVTRTCVTVAVLALTAIWIASMDGQSTSPRTIWDGIYTADQAKTGEAAYAQSCSSCHGEKLEGRGMSSALAGSDFQESWNGSSLGELFDRIQTSMPADRPGSLPPVKNAAILSFILKANGFPSGTTELPADAAALKGIRIEFKPAK